MYAGMSLGSAFDDTSRALLPVRKRSGRDELILWGRKDGEPGESEQVPVVKAETIKSGDWDRYHPRWVKLFLRRFRVPDTNGVPHWHDIPEGSFIQGVLIKDTDERGTRRVYIASIVVPDRFQTMSEDGRWPHVSEPGTPTLQHRSVPSEDSDIY